MAGDTPNPATKESRPAESDHIEKENCMFGRKSKDDSPEARELREAKKALANDPVNRGQLGHVSINSPAGRQNQKVQDRVRKAEAAYKRAKRG